MGNLDIVKKNVSYRDVLEIWNITLSEDGRIARCPIHKDKDPSLRIYPSGKFKCYGCGATGDVIDLFAMAEGVSVKRAIGILKDKFCNNKDVKVHDPTAKVKNRRQRKKPHFVNPDVTLYVTQCARHATETTFFAERGLIPEIVQRFRLGYDPETKNIIIPYNRAGSYYQYRAIRKKTYRKLPSELAGAEPIFNEFAFRHSPVIFIVESPLCAISIHQCGGVAVALCGVVNVKKMLIYLRENHYNGTLVVSLDNDVAGENATEELIQGIPRHKLDGLKGLKINYVVENIADEYKDPNELLVANWWRLRVNVQRVIMRIKRK